MLTFLLAYSIMAFSYKLYLQWSDGSKFYPDYFTNLVAVQSKRLLEVFGYTAIVEAHPYEPSMKLILNGKYLARVVEGCNAISVIILFVSFIVAFSGRLKPTVFYIFSGSVLIYVVNLCRIVVLGLGLYHFPEYEDVLHAVVFPAIIYGMVFLLWMLWVNRFSKIKTSHA